MDTIIKNAKIYVESGRFESAMLIRDGYIIAVGDIGEIEALAGQHKVIDAEGRTIVPGFIDSHMHLYNVGVSLRCVRLHGVSSVALRKTSPLRAASSSAAAGMTIISPTSTAC